LERAYSRFMNQSTNNRNSSNVRRSVGIADGDGFDGWVERQQSDDYYDRNNSRPSSRGRFSERDEEGAFRDYALSPPKVTDSVHLNRRYQNQGGGPQSPRGSWNGNLSPRGSYDSFRASGGGNRSSRDGNTIQVPRTSPSKMGTKVWGNETPLAKKGKLPILEDDNKWCCAVCLYVENPLTAEKCLVCDSVNYANRKVFLFASLFILL
jgi:hypothetical protein